MVRERSRLREARNFKSCGVRDCRQLGRTDGVPGHRYGRRVPNVREKGRGGGNPDPSSYEPLHAGLLPAETRAYTDTTAARGTTHFYTLEALRADGSVAGTHVWNCVFQDRV